MMLYIVRHAIAVERDVFKKKSSEDSLRPLTIKGKKRLETIIGKLKKELNGIDFIVTSPYVRAKQSALIISKLIKCSKIIESAELVPHAHPNAFILWLKAQAIGKKKVLIVGHEPHLGLFTSLMLLGQAKESIIDYKKSSVAALEVGEFQELTPGKTQLNWLVSPKLI